MVKVTHKCVRQNHLKISVLCFCVFPVNVPREPSQELGLQPPLLLSTFPGSCIRLGPGISLFGDFSHTSSPRPTQGTSEGRLRGSTQAKKWKEKKNGSFVSRPQGSEVWGNFLKKPSVPFGHLTLPLGDATKGLGSKLRKSGRFDCLQLSEKPRRERCFYSRHWHVWPVHEEIHLGLANRELFDLLFK